MFGVFDWVEASGRSPAEIYEHKIELAAVAERAGFHGFLVAEHHGTPLSIDGSPTALLSAIFQRTRRLRAGALTFCLPWYHPYRFYSEVCMLDQLSHGRLELGVGRGDHRPSLEFLVWTASISHASAIARLWRHSSRPAGRQR